MIIEEQCVRIANTYTTFVKRIHQIFTPGQTVHRYAKVDNSCIALSSDVVGDHGSQTKSSRTEIGGFSLRLL